MYAKHKDTHASTALLPLAHRLLITEVDLEVADADTFFPAFAEEEWREIGRHVLRTDEPGCVLRELSN